MSEDKAMSEQKSMLCEEIVVGSYVCSRHFNGMEGEVVRVEIDERGPEYDILHVKMNDRALPQRCQRVVMMLAERPDAEPASEPASDEVADLRLQLDLLKVELKSATDSRDIATSLLHKRQREYDNMHAALLRAEKGHADVQEELEKVRDELVTAQAVRAELDALRLDHAALTSTYAEIDAAYHKTHSERHALNEQNVELRAEVARLYGVESAAREEIDRLQSFLDREIANHEAADKYGRKAGDERDALRAQMIAKEENAAAEIERLRKLLDQVQEVATSNAKALRFAKRDVAMHQRRAQSWQGAAADALSQLEALRASREGEEPGRG